MYLENIFIGSEDIRKQLPQESLMFEEVHMGFMQAMRELQAAGNVVRATTANGVLAVFQVSGISEPLQHCLRAVLDQTDCCCMWLSPSSDR
jgi:hypothetical protein